MALCNRIVIIRILRLLCNMSQTISSSTKGHMRQCILVFVAHCQINKINVCVPLCKRVFLRKIYNITCCTRMCEKVYLRPSYVCCH